MNYLIVQQWPNTKGNHAGMVHMCDLLVSTYPNEYSKIEMDQVLFFPPRRYRLTNFLLGNFDKWRYKRKYLKDYLQRCHILFSQIKSGDKIFLLEYHLFHTDQFSLAKYLKKKFPHIPLIALSHLSPSMLRSFGFTTKIIQQWEKPIDIQLTLGSSLTQFFIKEGINSTKISTGFHYVDNKYYIRSTLMQPNNQKLKAIVIGNLQRNYPLLLQVIEMTPEINWTICCGCNKQFSLSHPKDNVKTVGFMDESELKKLMNESDISVNILDDTIGSNVITTSMAMGLAIIVSDVGSIHDYCSNENAIFCKNTLDSFTQAINTLSNNRDKLLKMKEASQEKAKKFSIENIHTWFNSL